MSKITTLAPGASLRSELIVSTLDQEPFITRSIDAGKNEIYSGYLVDLLNEVARRANFTYKFQQALDGRYGSLMPGGWSGIIGDVISGKADIGGAALTVTPQREEVVDFTKPYMSNSLNLLVQKPTSADIGLNYLLRPFSADYWVMFLVVIFLIGLVFFVIGKLSPYEWGNIAADRDPRGAKNSFTLRNSYLFALSTLTWQGFREAPHSLSGRIMAAFWWMFVLFSLVAYTSNLTAYMMVRPEQLPEMPFKTYEDILHNSNIRVGALGSGSTQDFLYKSQSDTLRSIWKKINSAGTWRNSYRQGIEEVKTSKGGYVFFMETVIAEYVARKNCDLMIYGDNLFPTSLALAVQKGSYLKNKINKALDEMKADGFLDLLKDKYWRFSGECVNIDGRKFVQTGGHLSSMPIYPISLRDMAVAILLLFLGFIAAIVFLIIEVIHYAVTKQGKKIEKPNILKNPPKILKNPPKIFKLKKKAAKDGPAEGEAGEPGEAGPSSDGLDSVPLGDVEDPGASADEGEKLQV